MRDTLLYIHSLLRWLVLFVLLFAIFRAWTGLIRARKFSALDNSIRHWTATIAHIQLIVGILVYTQSPIIRWFWNNFSEASRMMDQLFFGLIHGTLMLIAVVIVTVGSALAKRRTSDREKFATMLLWFTIALLIILIAVPWPFSPLAARPYLR